MEIASQTCPRCKTTKYMNPKLRLMVNVCGHKLCENCVDVIFTRPSAACPECKTPLRRNDFRVQQFEDLIVEKEVDIRKRILKTYNKRQEDFDTETDPLRSYNDYLEDVETVIFNLSNGLEVEETKRKIEKYKKDNGNLIRKNNLKLGKEEADLISLVEADREESETRKKKFLEEDNEEIQNKKKEKEALIDELISSNKPIEEIISAHKNKKNSVFFSSETSNSSRVQEQVIPLTLTDVPRYEYKPLILENYGPRPPEYHVLAARGYLSHVRAADKSEKASGFSEALACHRAIQDAFSCLYT